MCAIIYFTKNLVRDESRESLRCQEVTQLLLSLHRTTANPFPCSVSSLRRYGFHYLTSHLGLHQGNSRDCSLVMGSHRAMLLPGCSDTVSHPKPLTTPLGYSWALSQPVTI
ncbi:hypothetical protein [Cryptosporidium parvum Iowa II]|uniref:Uncharacterized protein n=2 Tax=Cryptosporidium parvum TaxID=5807 RepID=Q5CUU8_CRYPI|nr:hypothetical protein [Cryptosporidium parvum Iowa II]EAK89145.1 small hypothetical protein [Cryptosporidium parvum Iowa II]QOY42490.1 Uncharacterized protein CPATCC_0032370 [Cryptosporidium parvum]WKS76883.1 hypothetical protein CPCDC_3g1410 [Cryptosporidium sp. 43IA8]WRK31375.1 Uncharacterized protein cpbgf_3001410 [Cryptosporidium parvum]|eukprot:QOY42490.1 hypothetical protein CPATCC_001131 [Cryptosporidium parvum]